MSHAPAAPVAPASAVPDSPAARRTASARWRDPRLWVGLVLVAASVLVGARLLAAADDTVGVWVSARDLPAGAPLTAEALAVQWIRFTDPATADRYLPAGQPLPTHSVLRRDLAAGELVPRASLGARTDAAFELPVVVEPSGAPADLEVGDVVDVWVGPQAGSGDTAPAQRMLTAVPVVAAGHTAGPFGEAAARQVVLGLDERAVDRLGPVLGRMSSGSVVLVRRGAGR